MCFLVLLFTNKYKKALMLKYYLIYDLWKKDVLLSFEKFHYNQEQ